MGKVEEQRLYLQQQQVRSGTASTTLCERCSMGLSRIGREFSLKCVVLLIFSFSVFLPVMFWVIPLHSTQSEFDAKYAIKLRATVQASFRLQNPVSVLVPHIGRLEYDIYGEIGVPYTKVAILSMHRAGASNWTNVVFGVLSDSIDVSINPVSLSVLRSSLIELFLQQSNLTLTATTFGQPSSFEILKFPGGLTVIPEQSASIWQITQILFNFTLRNSTYEIKENLAELKQQLKLGLHLRSYENAYVQVTNINGSTIDPPVTVQAAVMSDLGSLLPQRLKQLAQTITGSPANNLGLNDSVFGKVKEVSLSSYLNRSIHSTPPTPSPAPAPEHNDHDEHSFSPSPDVSPSPSPACDDNYPSSPSPEIDFHHSLSPLPSSPAPAIIASSPSPTPNFNPTAPSAFPPHAPSSYPLPVCPTPQLSPNLSPLPGVSYGSSPRNEKGNAKGPVSPPIASPSISPSPSSFAMGPSYKGIWFFGFCGLLTFHLLCWS